MRFRFDFQRRLFVIEHSPSLHFHLSSRKHDANKAHTDNATLLNEVSVIVPFDDSLYISPASSLIFIIFRNATDRNPTLSEHSIKLSLPRFGTQPRANQHRNPIIIMAPLMLDPKFLLACLESMRDPNGKPINVGFSTPVHHLRHFKD